MFDNIMRPKMGDQTVILPVTFDYAGGRRESNKSRILWSIIIGILGVIFGIGLMFNDAGIRIVNILLGCITLYLTAFIIRFPLLKENRIRTNYITQEDSDYLKSFEEAWGIFSIDSEYPYYVHYRNGNTGLFVKMNKDVILGKYSESEFNHYEAIGDGYNLVGSNDIKLCHIDYMDTIGSDDRIQESFVQLGKVENTDVKDVLTDMFSYLQQQMNERVTTFDVYVFTFSCNESVAWNNILKILNCFLDGNFVSYHIMDKEDLRDFAKILMNLHDISVNQAMIDSINSQSVRSVIPIKLYKSEGEVEIFNKTTEEKKEEQRLKQEEKELREKELKRRKGKKKTKKEKSSEEEIDLF